MYAPSKATTVFHTVSAEDELAKHDLFRTDSDAVHFSNPCHLIDGFQGFGYALPLCHLASEKVQPFLAGFIDLGKILFELPGRQQIAV